ncbi:P-loop containing nucleoside triphosphate hydrolase protein [Entophlyctis helioformis]|nr:P-loop containing nucleoside triphosphate hydrolase protein [Entophlyctis helioformis]
MNSKDFEVDDKPKPKDRVKDIKLSPTNIMELNGLSVTSRNQLSVRNWRDVNEAPCARRSRSRLRRRLPASAATTMSPRLRRRTSSVEPDEDDDDDDEADAIARGRLVGEDESTKTAGLPTLSLVFFVLVQGVRIGADYWLRLWVPRIGGFTDAVYVGVFAAITGVFLSGVLGRGLWFTYVTSDKARRLHNALFEAVMHAPMAFFDTTPLGRVLSAFSKHMLHVDDTMLDAALQALQYFPLGLGTLILCAVIVPWNWATAIGMFSYDADIKTKPPIYAHLTATLEGLFSVRAYHAEDRFDAMNLARVDANHEALFAMQCVKSFQALYLDILSSLFIYCTTLLLVLSRTRTMLVFVQWTVRMWGDVENQMSSVGQLVYYAKVEPEAPFEIPDKKPPASWPTEGRIRFSNVVLKYQKFGVAVLKNVSCTIYPTEKIGIVGRTGSGKSTLLVSLLRIVEPCEGKITIDDLDVSQIGLHDLRNKVAIIPQEPVMFVGTLRSNLDPFHRSTDEEIWKALDAVQLGDKVRNMPSKLETAVTENGKSVSQGQRQLICIARAILSKAKILVLDEATASLDAQTDLLIQETIKKNFADLTMLTIAHRLNTIIECDRVLVMDAGKVVEFDEPVKLLDRPDGIFRSLVEQTGDAAAAKLRECAEVAHAARVARGYKIPEDHDTTTGPMTISEIAAKKPAATRVE